MVVPLEGSYYGPDMQEKSWIVVPHLVKDLPKGPVIKSVLEWVVSKGQNSPVIGVLAWFFREKRLAFLEEGVKIIHRLLEVVYAL